MELNQVLALIDSLKKEAETLLPVKPEFERAFWEKFRLEFNYNSNHMEGNTLTYGQTKLLLLFDRTSGDNKGREIEEMRAHDVALKMISEISSDSENNLTEKLIREINEIILVRPYYNDAITLDGQPTKRLITPGTYKKYPNSVLLPDGNMFYFASPEETPALMGDLIEWYNQNKNNLHPVKLAALMHYKLVRIHPFDDSNGRTARLIMNFLLMQYGYVPLVIESKKKEDYLTALNKADVGDIRAFEEYIAEVAFRWQEIFLKAIKGEKVEEQSDFEKEVELLKRALRDKDKFKQTFSRDLVLELIQNSFLPLFEKLIEKLSSLDHFYFNKEMRFGFNGPNFSIANFDQLKKVVQDQIESINLNSSIDFQYIHKGLSTKKSGAVNKYSDLRIKLYEFTYQIYTEHAILEKKYTDPLSDSEISEVVSEISRKSLEYTKQHLES